MRLLTGRPNVPDEYKLLHHVTKILESRRLTNNGPRVCQLEEIVAAYLGVRHCVAVANATLGLQIAAKALDLTGEVIMPSWTFVATAHAMKWIGLEPIFVDVRGRHLDPALVEDAITEKTGAIVPVHTFGAPCDIDEFRYISEKHGVPVVYDSAHAFGCSYNGNMIGGLGACEVFSFHATKFFNTFEGGAITTNDSDLAERCRRMRNFGFVDYDIVVEVGINAKMSEIHAAMGLSLLDAPLVAVNRDNYHRYRENLGELLMPHDEGSNFWYVVVETDNRDKVAEELAKIGVLARKYFHPGVHRMPPYDQREWDLPNTERLARRTLCLPTGPTVSKDDIDEICEVVLKWS